MFAILWRAVGVTVFSVSLFTAQSAAYAGSPSFDCGKAKRPTEFAICASDALAGLDNIVARAYGFQK